MATPSIARVAPDKHRLSASAAVALAVEVAILALAWAAIRHTSAEPPRERPPTMLSLTSAPVPQPAPARPAAPPVPKPQPARPVVQPKPRAVQPVHRVEPAAPQHALPVPQPAPTPTAAPTEPAPPPQAPAAPPAAPSAPSHVSPSFEGALRAAIQAALHYPESARMSGISGRTRVEFQYRDGVVSGERVITSSGVAMLDRAALAAVRDANVPKPESGFAGKTFTEQLWVNFNLSDQS